MPRKRYQRLMDWEQQAIADAYADGEKLLAIAAEFGTIESTVSRIAERRGMQRRTSRGPLSGATKPVSDPGFLAMKRKLAKNRREQVRLRAERREKICSS